MQIKKENYVNPTTVTKVMILNLIYKYLFLPIRFQARKTSMYEQG